MSYFDSYYSIIFALSLSAYAFQMNNGPPYSAYIIIMTMIIVEKRWISMENEV